MHAALRKQYVGLRVDATTGHFVVEADGRAVQRLEIKGIGQGVLPFATFVERLCATTRTTPRLRTVTSALHAPWHHR